MHVGADEIVHRVGHIERTTDGSTRAVSKCAYPRYSATGHILPSAESAGNRRDKKAEPTVNGWTANANAFSNPVEFLEAIWTVPSNPASFDGQTDFFFPGLEPLAGDPLFIMQPVLTYNWAGWSAASWNCCVDGTQFKSDDIPVAPGDSILGQIIGTGCSVTTSVCDAWYIYTRDQTTGAGTTLSTTAQGEVMDWAFAGAVEVYGVQSCADMPASGGVDFTYVQVQVLSGARNADWTPWTAGETSPNCNWGVTSSEFDAKFSWTTN
jgi:hypothetical protein